MILKRSEGYPSFVMVDSDVENRVIGFREVSRLENVGEKLGRSFDI